MKVSPALKEACVSFMYTTLSMLPESKYLRNQIDALESPDANLSPDDEEKLYEFLVEAGRAGILIGKACREDGLDVEVFMTAFLVGGPAAVQLGLGGADLGSEFTRVRSACTARVTELGIDPTRDQLSEYTATHMHIHNHFMDTLLNTPANAAIPEYLKDTIKAKATECGRSVHNEFRRLNG